MYAHPEYHDPDASAKGYYIIYRDLLIVALDNSRPNKGTPVGADSSSTITKLISYGNKLAVNNCTPFNSGKQRS